MRPLDFLRPPVIVAVMALSLFAIPSPPASLWAATIADSVADFSGSQGFHNWYYGFYDGDAPTPYQMGDFEQLPVFGGGLFGPDYWHETEGPGGFWTLIRVREQHPNGTNGNQGRQPVEQWAVRRWVSPLSGNVEITGSYTSLSNSEVIGTIIIDNATVWSRTTSSGHSFFDFDIIANLHVGSLVDFTLAPGADDVDDATDVIASIALVPEPSMMTLSATALMLVSVLFRAFNTAGCASQPGR